ncbi:MAG: hypothetical protein WAM28_03515 [Chlamydiales bacterium]
MLIKNVGNTSREEIVHAAYSILKEQGYLEIGINRKITVIDLSQERIFTESLRQRCVQNAAKKVDDAADYFFCVNGTAYCFDEDELDCIKAEIEDNFPLSNTKVREAVVDRDSETILMPVSLNIEVENEGVHRSLAIMDSELVLFTHLI